MRSHSRFTGKALLFLLLAVTSVGATACDKKADKAESAEAESEKKQAQIDALLRENGSAPASKGAKHPFGKNDGAAKPGAVANTPADAASPADAAPATAPTEANAEAATVAVISAGSGAKKELRYNFQANRKRAFTMEMTITSASETNGQKGPSPPPIGMALEGSSQTLTVGPKLVQRETTFLNVSATSKDLPPEMAQQMNAQFALLKGTQLIESVTPYGEVANLQLKDPSRLNPAVLGLIQSLKDGMTNAFIPLPSEAVGVGAKWKSTNTITATGMAITQTNEVELLSLEGSKAEVKLTFAQSAPAQEIKDPRLPPEAKIQLLSLKGGGTGTMKLDLDKVLVDGLVDLSMNVETKVDGPMVPAPQTTKAKTGVKIQVKLSE